MSDGYSGGSLVPSRVDEPRNWEVERFGTALRPVSKENEKTRRMGKISEKAILPLLVGWFGSIMFSFPEMVSSGLLALALVIAVMSAVLVGWKREPVVLSVDLELIEAVKAGHHSPLLDFLVNNPKAAHNLDIKPALMLWDKAVDVGGTIQGEVHNMLLAMAKSSNDKPDTPAYTSPFAKVIMAVGAGYSSSVTNENRQIKVMTNELDAILFARKTVEASISGIDPESLINPVRWSYTRALEATVNERKLLESVVDEQIDKNRIF